MVPERLGLVITTGISLVFIQYLAIAINQNMDWSQYRHFVCMHRIRRGEIVHELIRAVDAEGRSGDHINLKSLYCLMAVLPVEPNALHSIAVIESEFGRKPMQLAGRRVLPLHQDWVQREMLEEVEKNRTVADPR